MDNQIAVQNLMKMAKHKGLEAGESEKGRPRIFCPDPGSRNRGHETGNREKRNRRCRLRSRNKARRACPTEEEKDWWWRYLPIGWARETMGWEKF